mgnify:CR=1 FL=1
MGEPWLRSGPVKPYLQELLLAFNLLDRETAFVGLVLILHLDVEVLWLQATDELVHPRDHLEVLHMGVLKQPVVCKRTASVNQSVVILMAE